MNKWIINIIAMCLLTIIVLILSFVGPDYPSAVNNALFIKDEKKLLSIGDLINMKDGDFSDYDRKNTSSLSVKMAILDQNKGNIWFKIHMENNSNNNREKVMVIGFPIFKSLDFYHVRENMVISTEKISYQKDHPYLTRSIPGLYPAFGFTLGPFEKSDLYIRIEVVHTTLFYPLMLFDKSDFILWENINTYSIGLLIGILAAMSLYSIFAYFAIRERVYLYYSMLSLSILTFDYIFCGLGVIWPFYGHFDLVILSLIFILLIGIVSGIYFLSDFLLLSEKSKRYYIFLRIVALVSAIFTFLMFKIPENIQIYFSLSILVLSIMVGSIPLLFFLKQMRNRSFLLGFNIFFMGEMVTILSYFGLFRSNMISDNLHYIGHICLLLLLSKALTDLLKTLIEEKKIIKTAIMNGADWDRLSEKEEASYNSVEHVVSILFVDIVNFSLASKKLDPVKTLPILSNFISQINDIIYKYDGTIDRSLGDGVLAIFGYKDKSADIEDHALKAFLASVEIQGIWRGIENSYRKKIQVMPTRIGIHTDKVLVGNLGGKRRIDYTIISDGVNYASRLETACSPFKIMISEETFRRLPPSSYDKKAMNKINLSVKHESAMSTAYEYDPYFHEPEKLLILEKNFFISTEKSPSQRRITIKNGEKIIFKMRDHKFDVIDFSIDGFSAESDTFFALGSKISVELETSNEIFNHKLKSLLLDIITLDIRWSRVLGDKFRHGFRVTGLNERQRKFIFDELCNMVSQHEKSRNTRG